MRKFTKCFTLLALLAAFVIAPAVGAQDAMMDKGVVCDSTLVTLLLLAEHDYDYISGMMDSGMEMTAIDYGQYGPVIDSIVAMTMQMQSEAGSMEGNTPMPDMAAHDQMLADMMAMDTTAMVAAYMGSMNMTMEDGTVLIPGNVAGEDPACAQARVDVEKFILAHILTEMSMMSPGM